MTCITVQFHGIWGLYLGIEKAALNASDIDEALAELEGKFASQLKKKLAERGVHLDGDI